MKPAFSITVTSWLGILAAAIAAAPLTARGQTISNQDPRFTLRLPPGCVRQSGPPKALFTYTVGSPASSSFMVLGAESLEGEIAEETLEIPADAPHGTTTGFLRWHDMNLQVFGVRRETPMGTMVGRGVQVPLVGKAIEVVVLMPASQSGQIDRKLSEILDGLDGETSWPAARRRNLVRSSIMWICISLACGLIGWKFWWKRQRSPAQGYSGVGWISPNVDPQLVQKMIEGERTMGQRH